MREASFAPIAHISLVCCSHLDFAVKLVGDSCLIQIFQQHPQPMPHRPTRSVGPSSSLLVTYWACLCLKLQTPSVLLIAQFVSQQPKLLLLTHSTALISVSTQTALAHTQLPLTALLDGNRNSSGETTATAAKLPPPPLALLSAPVLTHMALQQSRINEIYPNRKPFSEVSMDGGKRKACANDLRVSWCRWGGGGLPPGLCRAVRAVASCYQQCC